MRITYPLGQKILFYLGYFFRKVFCLWLEVKRPKLKMFIYEMVYSVKKLMDYKALYVSPFATDTVETVFGIFRIRPGTTDMFTVSPAFERPDVDYLLRLLERLRDEGKRVLFLDIGADLGTFTVTVGTRLRDYPGLFVMAFEPAASSFELLKENIRLNGLEQKAEAFNLPLYSEDGLELEFAFSAENPGGSGLKAQGAERVEKVTARTLDAVLAEIAIDYDAAVIKMDVEGVECDVLKGAGKTLSSGKEFYILVEDFINPDVIACLEENGAQFMAKLSPYNSFWKLKQS
jgi:FkbM family methyltransferase